MTLVGKSFPSIEVKAIDANGVSTRINLVELAQRENKKILLFWYPKDFTFVCPSELHAFQSALAEFEKRNTMVLGASCDSAEVHFAWLNTPKNNGGIEGVTYPLIDDSNRNLSSVLGILDGQPKEIEIEGTEDFYLLEGDNVTFRATYIIDEKGVVVHESINHMPLGRNVEEFLRLIDAYAHVQEFGEVCPANWQKGSESMKPTREGVADYLSKNLN